jgi:hypothetical protein
MSFWQNFLLPAAFASIGATAFIYLRDTSEKNQLGKLPSARQRELDTFAWTTAVAVVPVSLLVSYIDPFSINSYNLVVKALVHGTIGAVVAIPMSVLMIFLLIEYGGFFYTRRTTGKITKVVS